MADIELVALGALNPPVSDCLLCRCSWPH